MNKLELHDFVVLRRPLLPYSILRKLNGQLKKRPDSLKALLCQAYKRPILREALYLASPALYDSLVKMESMGQAEPADPKVMLSLYKYVARAASRCTPFGLFAGYFVAELSEYTQIEFSGRIKKHTTLNAHVLQQIAHQLRPENTDDVLRVNNSLYRNGDYLRFTERAPTGEGTFEFALKEVQNDLYLATALQAARSGAKVSTIVQALRRQGLPHRHASEYVAQLCAEQILTGNTEPLVSLSTFQNALKVISQTESQLVKVFRDTAALAGRKDNDPARFAALEASLSAAGIAERNLVQIDMEFETTMSTVSRESVKGIVADLGKLLRTTQNRKPEALKSFATRFYQRYGDKQVPLLQALDPALGIGYGHMNSSYFGHVPMASQTKQSQATAPSAVERFKLIDRAYHDARHFKRKFYFLTDEDLKLIQPEHPPRIAEGVSVLGNLFCSGERDFDRGDYFFDLRGLSGPGSLHFLSRFADADTSLADRLRAVKAKETAQYPGAIVAEVNFVPAGRDANVARRPSLGDYHINLLCGPGQSGTSIAASDLMVSVRAGQVIVSSASLRKRIIPRLTTAYNPRLGPSAYQFLADVAVSENALTPLWDWGRLSDSPFLPRIQYRGIVLRKACWNLGPSSIPKKALSDQELVRWWQGLEKELDMPRFVLIGTGDQLLSIDGHSAPAVRICLDKLRREKSLCIQESLHSVKYGLLHAGRKMHLNEMVIPIFNHVEPKVVEPLLTTHQQASKRWVSAQDGWTYLKIYASEETCERLLVGKLFDFCLTLQQSNCIKGWFFLRFKDPDPHIRLRLFTGPGKQQSARFAISLTKKLKDEIESGLVFRLQSELYERELERYSSVGYEDIESIFCSDSYAIASSIALLQLNGQQTQRWLVAMIACDGLLTAFGKYNPAMKLQTLQAAGNVLEKNDLIALDQQFRQHREHIAAVMASNSTVLAEIRQQLNERNAKITHTLARNPISDHQIQQTLIIDLMHLCCNRLFISDQRRQEYAIYHFLKKFYDYQLKNKKSFAKI
jgi:thiopeptide-type bacteriocin biosynthesis protein